MNTPIPVSSIQQLFTAAPHIMPGWISLLRTDYCMRSMT